MTNHIASTNLCEHQNEIQKPFPKIKNNYFRVDRKLQKKGV